MIEILADWEGIDLECSWNVRREMSSRITDCQFQQLFSDVLISSSGDLTHLSIATKWRNTNSNQLLLYIVRNSNQFQIIYCNPISQTQDFG